MDILNYFANKLWVTLCKRESSLYKRSLYDVKTVQESLLLSVIGANRTSEYGRKFHFSKIKCIQDFQKHVPISEYSDYEHAIEKIMNGEQKILTSEAVNMFELSSGSTAPSKYIPYTSSLKRQFIAGINPWIWDLYSNFKELYWGKAYWSITPVSVKESKTSGGIPIGFEEDSQYFGLLEKNLLEVLFAVPREVKFIHNMDVFRYVTLLFLLKESSLTLISVWNPSFLILMLKPMKDWASSLLTDLKNGSISPPGLLSESLTGKLTNKLKKNPKRAKELSNIFTSFNDSSFGGRTVYEVIWPKLRLISCWSDANAAMYADDLKKLFPNTEIQGKGLIATEGFISIPFAGEEGARLSIRSHFFEFEEIDCYEQAVKSLRLAHELEQGKKYSVIITTGGGFYRYRLQDLIEVTGFTQQCPRFRFIGKEARVSDLCGEKLNEVHVKAVVEKALEEIGLKASFFMVAPEVSGQKDQNDSKISYVLYVEPCAGHEVQINKLSKLINQVEDGLRKNFHYNYCRQLEQLGSIRLFLIKGGEGTGLEAYHSGCRALGMREGNIKPCALHGKTGWAKEFKGEFV